ncbi:MAG: hypothetical protein OK449_03260 [Thaumarchaeota archaeon]|jgi:hypothetical protein|nr:hypothetical protein [Nitrososphaerota archaeon]
MDYLIYYLVPTAFLMVAFITWVLTKSVTAKTGIDVSIVLFLLAMMVAMLIGPAYLYLVTLDFTIGDVAIWEIAVFMSVGMMPIGILLFAKFWIQGDTDRKGPLPLSGLLKHVSGLRLSYIILLFFSELLMGWTFNLASGLIALSDGYTIAAVEREISYSLTTYWFVFTMVGEMALTLFAFRNTIRRNLLAVLGLQAVVMFLTPTALSLQSWETYTVYLEAVVMTGVVVFAIVYLRRSAERDRPLLDYFGLFIIANAIMMGGFLLWLATGETLLLALSLVVETVIYFDAVLTGAGLGETFRGASVLTTGHEPPVSASPAPPTSGQG